jgi:cell division protease FtsH
VSDRPDGGDDLREQLADLVRQLLEESPKPEGRTIGPMLRAHLGIEGAAEGARIYTQELERWELPNLQLALDAAVARPGWSSEIVGLGGNARHYHDLSLSGFLTADRFAVGSVEYVNVPVGPSRTLACLELAVLLVTAPEGQIAAFVHRGREHHGESGLTLQTTSPHEGLGERFLEDTRALMDEHDVYRRQVITIEPNRFGASTIAFLERPTMEASDLVLPPGALQRIETHILAPTRHRDQLVKSGRHMARGLLLYGPPGTGKTHTVRYLTSRLTDATIILLSAGTLGMIGAFGTLGRKLAPAVVVLEDVDLVAHERSGPFGGGPALFELMNQMSGLADDADIAFVLTTNRADVLEPALAARPGRIDLAVEIPLPDAAARIELIELYSRGLTLDVADRQTIVDRTEGVTASFIKELLRKAAVTAAEAGRDTVTDADISGALDELLELTGALTRVLLGVPREGAPHPTALPPGGEWMQHFPGSGAMEIRAVRLDD